MRLRVLLSAVLVAAVLSISYVPNAVLAALPNVATAAAAAGTFSDYVNCSGEIVSSRKNEIYCAVPVYALQVLVSVGDRIEEGQALAVVDKDITAAVAKAAAGDTGKDYSEILGNYGLDEETALKLIGGYSSSGAINTERAEYQAYDIPGEITATMSGIVTEVNIFPRVLTDSAAPLFVIEDDSQFGVRLSAGEAECVRINEGDKVIVTGSGFEGAYEGYITKIYPTARKELSGTVTETVVDLEAVLYGGESELKSGFSAKGNVLISEPAQVVLVPYKAVRQDERNREYVYVYSNGVARRRDVVTGAELSDSVAVVSGLKAGEKVVLQPDELDGTAAIVIEVKAE